MDNFETMDFDNMAQNLHGDPFANIPMNDIDIGRESIPLLELSTSFGRESLGILKIDCDINNHLNNATQFNNTDISPNVLDQAFLLSSHSDLKSASTIKSSNFSFNLNGHDQISPINISDFPNSFRFTGSTNILNDGFLYTTALSEKFLQQYRSRFNSLPLFTLNNEVDKVTAKQLMNRASEGCMTNCSILEEEGNGFNDSVFIEARHLATKFNDEGSKDGFILDDTDPPELINGDLESSNNSKDEKIKYDSDEVFKRIDKLLPVDGLQQLNKKLDNLTSDHTKQQNDLVKQVEENLCTKQPELQLSNPNDNAKTEMNGKSDEVDHDKDTTPTGCVQINTEESDKILRALSLILAKSDRSEKETEEGQCLLNTLADMLSNSSKEKCKSVIGDSIKSIDEITKIQNVSTKSQDGSNSSSFATGNRLRSKKHSNSFSMPNKVLKTKLTASVVRSPSFDGSKTRNSVSSAESSVEVRNYSAENPSVNLKLKKVSSTTTRRGPMKATVPLENITKPQIKGTPTKAQQIMPKLKSRISTPIRDIQLKPMAQSTPDHKVNNSSTSSMELTNIRSLSSSNMQEKSNHSSPTTSVSSYRDSFLSKDRPHISQLPRRNSVSECRKTSTPDVKRTSSMKETSLMKAMNKIRQNMSVSKGPLRDCSNVSSRESFSTSGKIITTPKRVVSEERKVIY
ncbi:uncharacterized protein LOC123306886 isoform X2 [Coccinella septempunctata]|uniref:uncharacterized protein LOC123306886 isoform X2 n=1 Tax=Coccinella septempunctata TaxID=41139 RepID=UPI001D06F1C4|nr:uncharacterized protein LOC123306886 isoform X2 [Coccinella septempunctata]